MAEDYLTIAHEWFELVWNQGQEGEIDRLFAQDGIAHGLSDSHGAILRGPAGYKPFYHAFRSAIPDIHVEVIDTVVEGDKVAARCIVRGTHDGDGLGMAATGNTIEFTGMAILRIRDGQIVEAWNNFDFATLNVQLAANSGHTRSTDDTSSGSDERG